jgi:serine/threonine-protein phosphatase 6 regulatory ankyrin repeat subunit B
MPSVIINKPAYGNNRRDIVKATSYGHLDVLKYFIEKGESVNYVDDNSNTLLHFAVIYRNLNVLKFLIEEGADIDKSNDSGETPLNSAASLLSAKDKHDSKEDYIGSLIQRSFLESIELLLAAGADVSKGNHKGRSPLFFAASVGNLEVVELLLDAGADVTQADDKEITPLYEASRQGHLKVLELLIKKGSDVNKHGSLLYAATENGHFEVMKLLLAEGANPNTANGNGETPLYTAAENGHFEVIKLLLENGANPNAANGNGETPLLVAVKNADKTLVKLLIAAGANVNYVHSDGQIALSAAVSLAHETIAKLLIAEGAVIDQTDVSGRTTLHVAVQNGHLEMARLLLQEDSKEAVRKFFGSFRFMSDKFIEFTFADSYVDQATVDGETSLYIAAKNGHIEMVQLLLEEGNNSLLALYFRAFSYVHSSLSGDDYHYLSVKYWIGGANINKPDIYGVTPLAIAVKNSYTQVVRLLLFKCADVYSIDNFGNTPLSIAKQDGNTEIIELLEDHQHTLENRDESIDYCFSAYETASHVFTDIYTYVTGEDSSGHADEL